MSLLPKKKEVYNPTDEQVGNGAYYDLREIIGWNAYADAVRLSLIKGLKNVLPKKHKIKIVPDWGNVYARECAYNNAVDDCRKAIIKALGE